MADSARPTRSSRQRSAATTTTTNVNNATPAGATRTKRSSDTTTATTVTDKDVDTISTELKTAKVVEKQEQDDDMNLNDYNYGDHDNDDNNNNTNNMVEAKEPQNSRRSTRSRKPTVKATDNAAIDQFYPQPPKRRTSTPTTQQQKTTDSNDAVTTTGTDPLPMTTTITSSSRLQKRRISTPTPQLISSTVDNDSSNKKVPARGTTVVEKARNKKKDTTIGTENNNIHNDGSEEMIDENNNNDIDDSTNTNSTDPISFRRSRRRQKSAEENNKKNAKNDNNMETAPISVTTTTSTKTASIVTSSIPTLLTSNSPATIPTTTVAIPPSISTAKSAADTAATKTSLHPTVDTISIATTSNKKKKAKAKKSDDSNDKDKCTTDTQTDDSMFPITFSAPGSIEQEIKLRLLQQRKKTTEKTPEAVIVKSIPVAVTIDKMDATKTNQTSSKSDIGSTSNTTFTSSMATLLPVPKVDAAAIAPPVISVVTSTKVEEVVKAQKKESVQKLITSFTTKNITPIPIQQLSSIKEQNNIVHTLQDNTVKVSTKHQDVPESGTLDVASEEIVVPSPKEEDSNDDPVSNSTIMIEETTKFESTSDRESSMNSKDDIQSGNDNSTTQSTISKKQLTETLPQQQFVLSVVDSVGQDIINLETSVDAKQQQHPLMDHVEKKHVEDQQTISLEVTGTENVNDSLLTVVDLDQTISRKEARLDDLKYIEETAITMDDDVTKLSVDAIVIEEPNNDSLNDEDMNKTKGERQQVYAEDEKRQLTFDGPTKGSEEHDERQTKEGHDPSDIDINLISVQNIAATARLSMMDSSKVVTNDEIEEETSPMNDQPHSTPKKEVILDVLGDETVLVAESSFNASNINETKSRIPVSNDMKPKTIKGIQGGDVDTSEPSSSTRRSKRDKIAKLSTSSAEVSESESCNDRGNDNGDVGKGYSLASTDVALTNADNSGTNEDIQIELEQKAKEALEAFVLSNHEDLAVDIAIPKIEALTSNLPDWTNESTADKEESPVGNQVDRNETIRHSLDSNDIEPSMEQTQQRIVDSTTAGTQDSNDPLVTCQVKSDTDDEMKGVDPTTESSTSIIDIDHPTQHVSVPTDLSNDALSNRMDGDDGGQDMKITDTISIEEEKEDEDVKEEKVEKLEAPIPIDAQKTSDNRDTYVFESISGNQQLDESATEERISDAQDNAEKKDSEVLCAMESSSLSLPVDADNSENDRTEELHDSGQIENDDIGTSPDPTIQNDQVEPVNELAGDSQDSIPRILDTSELQKSNETLETTDHDLCITDPPVSVEVEDESLLLSTGQDDDVVHVESMEDRDSVSEVLLPDSTDMLQTDDDRLSHDVDEKCQPHSTSLTEQPDTVVLDGDDIVSQSMSPGLLTSKNSSDVSSATITDGLSLKRKLEEEGWLTSRKAQRSQKDNNESQRHIPEKPTTIAQKPRFNIERIRMILFAAGRRAHVGRGYEKMFLEYCNAIGSQLKGTITTTEMQRSRAVVHSFLKTKLLKKLHNKLIFALLARCVEPITPLHEIQNFIPDKWRPRIHIANERVVRSSEPDTFRTTTSAIGTSTCLHLDKTVPYYTPLCKEIKANPFVQQQQHGTLSNSPLRIPAALVIDPIVRARARSENLTVSENAVWLLVVAMREYMKSLLSHCVNFATDVERGIIPSSSLQKTGTKRLHSEIEKDQDNLTATKQDDSTDGRPVKMITSRHVQAIIATSPIGGGARSLSSRVSRTTFERSNYTVEDAQVVIGQEHLANIRNFLVSSIVTKQGLWEPPGEELPVVERKSISRNGLSPPNSIASSTTRQSPVGTKLPSSNIPNMVSETKSTLVSTIAPIVATSSISNIMATEGATTSSLSIHTQPDPLVKNPSASPTFSSSSNAPSSSSSTLQPTRTVPQAASSGRGGLGRGAKDLASLLARAKPTTPNNEGGGAPTSSPVNPTAATGEGLSSEALVVGISNSTTTAPSQSIPTIQSTTTDTQVSSSVSESVTSPDPLRPKMDANTSSDKSIEQGGLVKSSTSTTGSSPVPSISTSFVESTHTTTIPSITTTAGATDDDPQLLLSSQSPTPSSGTTGSGRRGKGFGIKNLKAMLNRSSTNPGDDN